jgi:hypothetical protein
MNMNGGQDWDQVVLKKKKPTNSQLKDESAVNAVSPVIVTSETLRQKLQRS